MVQAAQRAPSKAAWTMTMYGMYIPVNVNIELIYKIFGAIDNVCTFFLKDSETDVYLTTVQEDLMEFKLSYEMWRVGKWAVHVTDVRHILKQRKLS